MSFGRELAVEVDELGGEKSQHAKFRSIVAGEDEVGKKSGEKSKLQETIFGRIIKGIKETQKNAADFNNSEQEAVGRDQAKNTNTEINQEPAGAPDAHALAGEKALKRGFHAKIITWNGSQKWQTNSRAERCGSSWGGANFGRV